MANILIRLPFNGTNQGTGAIPVTANLQGAEYGVGRITEPALRFPAIGRAEVLNKVFPFSGTFTFAFWLKVAQQAGGPTASWLLYKFAGANRYIYVDLTSTLTRWSYIVLIQDTDRISVYLNAKRIATEVFPAGWGNPTGFALVNDSPAPSGFMTTEDVTLYDAVDYSVVKPAIPTPTPALAIRYTVNGSDFNAYGVSVSESKGLLDNLELKDPARFEWPDYHGEVIDLAAPRYQARTITLSCFLAADNTDDFIEKLSAFLAQFQKKGTQRLKVNAYSIKPHVYEVYLSQGINLNKKWSDDTMIGTFELTLVEPEPVKRVLSFGTGQVSITLTTAKIVNIHWGDGTHTYDVYGTNLTVTHTYQTAGPHEIIISGVIEDITAFTSTATILWNLLL